MRTFEGNWLTAEAKSNENCKKALRIDIKNSLVTWGIKIFVWIC